MIDPPSGAAGSERQVTEEEWVEDNEQYLLHIWEWVQQENGRTGRRVMNASKLPFSTFCEFAFRHSTLYTLRDREVYNSDGEEDEEEEVNLGLAEGG